MSIFPLGNILGLKRFLNNTVPWGNIVQAENGLMVDGVDGVVCEL